MIRIFFLCLVFLAEPLLAAAPLFMGVMRTDDRTPVVRKKGTRDYPVFYLLDPADPALSKARKNTPASSRYVLLGEKAGRGLGFFLLEERGLEDHTREVYWVVPR